MQRAKKVVSDSPGLVDFFIGLVNSVDNLYHRQVKFLGKFKLQNSNQFCRSIIFGGLVEMMLGLVHASYQLARMATCNTDFLCSLP